jgi:WD40 repeat protein
MALSSNDKLVYTASHDGTLRQWRTEPPASPDDTLSHFGTPLFPAGFSTSGDRLITLTEKSVHFWRVDGQNINEDISLRADVSPLGKLPVRWGGLKGTTAVSPNGQWLAYARPREAITVINIHQPEVRHTFPSNDIPVQSFGFSPDSRLLLVRRSLTRFVTFDTATWNEADVIETPGAGEQTIPFSFAGRTHVLAVGSAASVVLWDTLTKRVIKEIPAEKRKAVVSLGISADAALLAMGYTDNTFTLHDCKTGQPLGLVPSHVGGVDFISFSPDGKTLATASGRWVRLWNIKTLREMFPLELSSAASFVAFNPNGTCLVAGEMNGTTHLWPAPHLAEIQPKNQAGSPR